MAPIRTSNLERSRWRSKCRELLSEHIQNRVGIRIEPSQVRLVTGADDLYSWKVLPEKKYLFLKNISDHSTGTYKELCEGIGRAFEAVSVTATKTKTDSADSIQEVFVAAESSISFSARIDELCEENLTLEQELRHWKDQAAAELEHRWRSEQEINQLTNANQTLQRELQKSVAATDYFRNNTYKYIQVANRIQQLMEELRTGTTLNGEISGEWDLISDHALGPSVEPVI